MASVTAIREGILTLTTDPEQRAKLVRKLEEYKKRYMFRAPDADTDGFYKLTMLGELVENGIIDFEAKEQEFARHEWHRPHEFQSVVKIIKSYNSGDQSGIYGGTGLA
jgi:hypothetical protein